jgi:hypothetical protein
MRGKSGPWKELVDDAAQRKCLHPVVPAGPGHANGQSVSTPDYDARVLETKVETHEVVIKRDRGRDRDVRERSPEPSGPRRVVVVRKRARTPERQAGHRQPREQPGQQQRRRVVVNTSPAQKRRELEDKARRELQDKLVVKAKLDEQRGGVWNGNEETEEATSKEAAAATTFAAGSGNPNRLRPTTGAPTTTTTDGNGVSNS